MSLYQHVVFVLQCSVILLKVVMPSAIILSVMVQYIKLLTNFYLPALLGNGKPYWRGRLTTVDLLIKIGCFVKKDSFNKKSS